jgi:hypothetical protein
MDLTVTLEEAQVVGKTPAGFRRNLYAKGGRFAGPKLSGEVLAGGGDWALDRPDGVIQLDVRITLRTDDLAMIYTRYHGVFDVEPQVLQRVRAGEDVDPLEYYFRITPVFETSAREYQWLNRIVSVGVGRRTPIGVTYRIFQIK